MIAFKRTNLKWLANVLAFATATASKKNEKKRKQEAENTSLLCYYERQQQLTCPIESDHHYHTVQWWRRWWWWMMIIMIVPSVYIRVSLGTRTPFRRWLTMRLRKLKVTCLFGLVAKLIGLLLSFFLSLSQCDKQIDWRILINLHDSPTPNYVRLFIFHDNVS